MKIAIGKVSITKIGEIRIETSTVEVVLTTLNAGLI